MVVRYFKVPNFFIFTSFYHREHPIVQFKGRGGCSVALDLRRDASVGGVGIPRHASVRDHDSRTLAFVLKAADNPSLLRLMSPHGMWLQVLPYAVDVMHSCDRSAHAHSPHCAFGCAPSNLALKMFVQIT